MILNFQISEINIKQLNTFSAAVLYTQVNTKTYTTNVNLILKVSYKNSKEYKKSFKKAVV